MPERAMTFPKQLPSPCNEGYILMCLTEGELQETAGQEIPGGFVSKAAEGGGEGKYGKPES